ncbi:MAG: hypothetical protein ACOC6J_10925, partial [Spirochaetota bacterium]
VAQSLYRQQLEYLGALTRQGAVEPMTLTEFADWFRENRRIGVSEVYFAKELLYGSGKHYVWYLDTDQRILIDTTQGGSIGDLRPYAGRVEVQTGPERPELAFGSYPYLIQSQHRTGMQNHFQDGARSTALLCADGESVDLATVPTRVAALRREPGGSGGAEPDAGERIVVELEPVTVRIAGADVRVRTTTSFRRGGVTAIRRFFDVPRRLAGSIVLTERVKLAPGITEYPQPIHGVSAAVRGSRDESLDYAYNGRTIEQDAATSAEATVPSVSTRVRLVPGDGASWTGTVEEGHLFSPFVTLALTRNIDTREETEVWLITTKR